MLHASPKRLPPKFFYDSQGSRLFEKICELPEYYLTRAETAILRERAKDIAGLITLDSHASNGNASRAPVLIEFGAGAGRKIRILLDVLGGRGTYIPIDISKRRLLDAADEQASCYPQWRVAAVCADYSKAFSLPPGLAPPGSPKVGFFPGSTIGNLDPAEAVALLQRIVRALGPGGAMLLGVDLKKDPAILHAAYNDSAGVTGEFNLNLLRRMNRELGANFEIEAFRHRAFYNEPLGRMEMHLESLRDQRVWIQGRAIALQTGERIHTENSYKYTLQQVRRLAAKAGFRAGPAWTDADGLFSVHYLTVGDETNNE